MPDPQSGTLPANVHNPAFGAHEYKAPEEAEAINEAKAAADRGEGQPQDQPAEGQPAQNESGGGEDEQGDEGANYDTMLKAELEEMANERGLEVEGNLKSDYVAALEADDAAKG